MLRLILLIVIIILVLSFFGISLQSVLTSPTAHENFNYALQLLLTGWNLFVQSFQNLLTSIADRFANVQHAYSTPDYGQ
jgi:CHASE3 domain sensor protein